jgi:ATP-dependent 26S proteasome regulatory subunit
MTLTERIDRQICQHSKALVGAALDGNAPLAVLLQRLDRQQFEDASEKEIVSVCKRMLAEFMDSQGFYRYRTSYLPQHEENIVCWLYYRPSEEDLFRAVDDPSPILLVSTSEPQRFARAIIEHSNRHAPFRPVQIWTCTSGLFEVKGVGKNAVFHPVSDVIGQYGDAEVSIGLVSGQPDTEAAASLRKLINNDAGWKESEASTGGRLIKIYSKFDQASDSGKVKCHAVIDDLSETFEHQVELSQEQIDAFLKQLFVEAVELRLAENLACQRALCTNSFASVLNFLIDNPLKNAVVMLFDGQYFLSNEGDERTALNARALKDAFYRLRRNGSGVKIVIFSNASTLSSELHEEVQRLELPLPRRRELEIFLGKFVKAKSLPEALLDRGAHGYLTRLVDSAAGMTLGEVRNVLERYATSGDQDPSTLIFEMHQAKKNSVARSPALEVMEHHNLPDTVLGGLNRLTDWLDARRKVFERPEAARAMGIDRRPKGVLLLGIPGTGKSLAAKVVAKRWGLPLLRLDIGAVHNRMVGASEERIRHALKTVAAMAPCVLWIDEIDKGMGQGDGQWSSSTDSNIRATLLTWMQEYREPVFVIATANQISVLPPELMRAGRFDARFFLGCPGAEGRCEILRIHLSKRRIALAESDIVALGAATHGYTGAEIEQLVLDVLYDVFNEDETGKPSMQHFHHRLAHTQPLIKTIGAASADGRRRGALDEVWNLIEEGRVEFASDDLLTRAQVARLIDPMLYRPVYCRLGGIEGFEKLHTKGERLVMGAPMGAPALVIFDSGDDEWLYVQTNVRYDQLDQHNFAFLERLKTIEDNGVIDILVSQHGIERIIFAEQAMRTRVGHSYALLQYEDLFHNAWEQERA